MDNWSNGHCGGAAPQTFDKDIPLSGYNTAVYNVDDSGCGDNHWDEGGLISVNGKCNGEDCLYNVTVSAHHGGVDGQCNSTNTVTYPLEFRRPVVYTQLSQLSNFNFNQQIKDLIPSVIGKYVEYMNATLGTQGGTVAQAVTCQAGAKSCIANGLYSNGLSATSMLYNIGLNAGDTLKQGVADFTRSEGYELSDFTVVSE